MALLDTLENTYLNMIKTQFNNYGLPNTPTAQMANQQRY